EMSEGPASRPSLAGPGPSDTSVSDRGARKAPKGERVASSSARRPSRLAASDSTGGPRRTYVLDTSVLLADPAAIGRFAEHRVGVPVAGITAPEHKSHHQ